MTFDLIIVGASFSGLSCAKEALERGLSVAIIEKKTHAGDKLHSTGILVKEVLDDSPWIQVAPSELFKQIDMIRLYAPNMRVLDLRAAGYYFTATDTSGLMNWMVQDVELLGGTVFCSTLFEVAKQEVDGLWHIPVTTKIPSGSIERNLKARYLIGADGPTSRVARALGLSVNTEFLYGMEKEYATDQVELGEDCFHCFLDQRLAAGYIGWAFASVGCVQVGLARRLPSQRKGYKQAGALQHNAFVEKLSPVIQLPSQAMGVRAGMIPCGGTLKQISRPNAMLVGDAAGTVSPVTAGGIHSAVVYGQKAGVAVSDYLQGKERDPAEWLVKQYPSYKVKGFLRWGYDHFQSDWLFSSMLSTALFRRMAEQVYFHKKGQR